MNLAFIGLGQMGRPMALNLLKHGAALNVMSASGRHDAAFGALGARAVRHASGLADARIVFLCLPDRDAVRDTVDALTPVLAAGSIVVDTSTIAPADALAFAAACSSRDIGFVDAPVSGMQARAIDGTLTAMCGASPEHFRAVEPWLKAMASTVLHMGPVGSGQLAKLVNQLLFDINAAALAELLPMAVKLGLDADKLAAVVNSGTGRSHASEFFLPRILQRRFADGYPMRSAYKDLVTGAELGAAAGIPLPVLAAATTTYQTALLQGHGHLDKGAMIQVFETLLGVQFRSTPAPSTESTR